MLIDEDEKLLIDSSPVHINEFAFLYNIQRPRKQIDCFEYFKIVTNKRGTSY